MPSQPGAARPPTSGPASSNKFNIPASFRVLSDIQPPQPGRHQSRFKQEVRWLIAEQDPTRGRTSPPRGAARSPATGTPMARGARSAATPGSPGRGDGQHPDHPPHEDFAGPPTWRWEYPHPSHRRNEGDPSVTSTPAPGRGLYGGLFSRGQRANLTGEALATAPSPWRCRVALAACRCAVAQGVGSTS